MDTVLIFPHHLFEKHSAFSKDRLHVFIEHPLFFFDKHYPAYFHKQKLVLHRASMREFEKELKKKKYKTAYIDYKDALDLSKGLKKLKPSSLHVSDFDDYILEMRIKKLAEELDLPLQIYPSQGFLESSMIFEELFEGKKSYSMQTFYAAQRKNLGILIDKGDKPVGGKWSFDKENRKKAPASLKFPKTPTFKKTKVIQEAIRYVEKNFPDHPGDPESFSHPTTHSQGHKCLKDFLKNRLELFGDYEDAIVQKEETLFHSRLSLLLNTGLLTPDEVITETLDFAKKHKTPLNSLEGFIRQVIGWREFIRQMYHHEGTKQRKSNFFKHKRKMPKCFYEGTSGIEPIDDCIEKLKSSAYLHHIERLMVLGSFFLLCEIDPDEIYRWFMEMFIDAYDWVMVPNVYGMSQYADGGLMTTKPYICGSNYICKMSDYKKGEWADIWDSLFWRFMDKHLSFFKKQPRMNMLIRLAKEKGKDKAFMKIGEDFLKSLRDDK